MRLAPERLNQTHISAIHFILSKRKSRPSRPGRPILLNPTVDLMQILSKKILGYIQLMRLDRPIGIYLVLWPTLWSLWLAAEGVPNIATLMIFVLGAVLMRSAGCVINDFADRKIDGKIKRTNNRPLITKVVSPKEAIALFVSLSVIAFILVLQTNVLTVYLSFGAVALAFCYPFVKRHSHLPQVVLGAAFAWSVPMAFAAQKGVLIQEIALIYVSVLLWTIAYDTFYGMVDREDDIKAGVKSTAILFGDKDLMVIGSLQVMVIFCLVLIGEKFTLSWPFQLSVLVAASLFIYQQWLAKARTRKAYFNAFLNNNWVGLVIFVGIAGHYFL